MTGGQVGGPRRAPSGREKEGLGGEQVEGRHAVLELLKARRRQIQKIFVADAQDASETLDAIEFEAQRQRVPVQVISMARLDREARTEGHQGVMAIAARLETVSLDELLEHRHPFLLVCDGVTDPRNLGAMLRSADGAGVTGVVVPRHRSARISPSVTKTAAGAIEYLTFCDVGRCAGGAGGAQQGRCTHRRPRRRVARLDLRPRSGDHARRPRRRGRRKGTFRVDAQALCGRCVDTPVGQDQFVERRCRRVGGSLRSGASAKSTFVALFD